MLINDTPKVLSVDNVIVCADPKLIKPLQQPLEDAGFTVHIIGGADVAAELDAKRAIPKAQNWQREFKTDQTWWCCRQGHDDKIALGHLTFPEHVQYDTLLN